MTQLVVMAMHGEEGDSSFLLCILHYSIKGKPEIVGKAVLVFFLNVAPNSTTRPTHYG